MLEQFPLREQHCESIHGLLSKDANCLGLGFRVGFMAFVPRRELCGEGLGFRVWCLGFRVLGLAFRGLVFRFRV